MTWTLLAQISVETALAVFAWLVARREPGHRIFAALATYHPIAELARLAISTTLLPLPRPFHGVHRVFMHVDEGLFLVWYAALAAASIHYFLKSRPWPVALAALAAFAIVLDYPRMSGTGLRDWYRVVTCVSVALAWGAALLGLVLNRVGRPSFAHYVVGVYAATEGVTLATILARDALAHWRFVQYAAITTLGATLFAHVWWLLRSRNERKGDQ